MSSLMFPYGALDLLHDHRHHNHDHEHDKRDKLRAALISSGSGASGSYPTLLNVIEEENDDRDHGAGQILVIVNAGSGGIKRKQEKFRLHRKSNTRSTENSNVSAILAKCENGS
ncbi:hypothetical protein MKW92_040997 [Papaver armeniacum]|nr:hypothetical protein MKW92_040997 [Papaver armeniacum]